MNYEIYKPTDDDYLQAWGLYESGKSCKEIAELFGHGLTERRMYLWTKRGRELARIIDIRIEKPITRETLLDDTLLSARTKNGLLNGDCSTVGDALELTNFELLRIPNFGKKSLFELREFIDSADLGFDRAGAT